MKLLRITLLALLLPAVPGLARDTIRFINSLAVANSHQYDRIDGSPYSQSDIFTPWSGGLHLPWLVMLDDRLPEGRHRLSLRMAAAKNPKSTGTACRIHQFAVN